LSGNKLSIETKLFIGVGIALSFIFIYLYILVLYRQSYFGLVLENENNLELLDEVKKKLIEQTEMEDELKKNYQIQTLLSDLLQISLLNTSLNEQLDEILNKIQSATWLDMHEEGCVYLIDDKDDVLVMNAYIGLHQSLISSFKRNPKNLCLCGKNMGSGKGGHLDVNKSRHILKTPKDQYEVHYYLPIKHGNKNLGILNLLMSGPHPINDKEDEFFQSVVDVLAGVIEQYQTDEKLNQTVMTLRAALGGTIHAMALTVEIRDPYTAGHQRRVSNLARAIATEMHLSKDQIEGVRIAGIVHDLGKISVPSEILSKPGNISLIEYSLINTHPQKGFEILNSINFPWPIAQIVLQHHERLDGSGYPAGLKEDQILIEAQVLMVADVVEAMSSHRPYRPSRGNKLALEEVMKNKGLLYNSKAVDACLKLFLNDGFQFDHSSDVDKYEEPVIERQNY
jgi:HD-GYP domain-containing protein (c-di-GMP phosphodiesterase class II)